MALGAGKYDHLCTQAREGAKAKGAILIILGGDGGTGGMTFSVQATPEATMRLPEMLRAVASMIEEDIKSDLTQLIYEEESKQGNRDIG